MSCPPQLLDVLNNAVSFEPLVVASLLKYLSWLFLLIIVLGTFTYFLFKEVTLPLQEMQYRALKFSRGIFSGRMPDYRIQELNRFAKTMNKLGIKLEGLELMRKDFVANVSHELKTPITSIKGYVETILEGGAEDPEEAKRFLSVVKQQADRMNAIIEDLILISKLENETNAISSIKEERLLFDLLACVKSQLQFMAKQKNINLLIECPGDLLISCNPMLLEQALSNILDNAIKYCQEGSRVEVSVTSGAELIEVSVKDNGPGISSNHLPRIFERFYRVDKARSRFNGGSGLGLSITKHIIYAHGGGIFVKSESGFGTEFTIELAKAA